ncbi:MAG: hypothetical protein LBI53_07670 [Candidatus Peribacteria bacterium]|jgi:hypothetical protein|nr:hypothetical protein [Candidatus Peribacteria bacterium]
MRNYLQPIQARYKEISDEEIIQIIQKNTPYIQELAEKKIQEVYKKT